MPVSTSVHISYCLALIIQLNPRSVLDVGCGVGMWGFLCRTYLDVINERVQPDQWQVRIDGTELFEPYIQAHHRSLYSSILIGDIREMAPNLDEYELIIAGDIIEHLEKDEGEVVLEQLYDKATKALLVNIPIGEGWDHPERHGNPGELHRSQWAVEDFVPYAGSYNLFELPCGQYGVFYLPKDCPTEDRIEGLLRAARRRESEGNLPAAERCFHRVLALDPSIPEAVFFVADALIRAGAPDDAANLLANAVETDPTSHQTYLFLGKLLASLSRRDEARTCLEKLLALDGVAEATRQEAEQLLNTFHDTYTQRSK